MMAIISYSIQVKINYLYSPKRTISILNRQKINEAFENQAPTIYKVREKK